MGKRIAKKHLAVTEHRKNFIDLIDKLAYRNSRWNVFNDFLEVAAVSFSNSDVHLLATDKETWEAREKLAIKTLSKYTYEEQQYFPKLLAELTLEFENDFPNYVDVLGEMFHALNFHDEWKGQFFTPQNVSDMIGMCIVDTDIINKQIKERGFFTALEPCSGAGGMILGMINAMHKVGLNHRNQVFIVANDIDERCVLMTYIQLSLAGVPAIVQQKDSISGTIYGSAWYTPVFIFDGWMYKMQSVFEKPRNVETSQNITENIVSKQISLF